MCLVIIKRNHNGAFAQLIHFLYPAYLINLGKKTDYVSFPESMFFQHQNSGLPLQLMYGLAR